MWTSAILSNIIGVRSSTAPVVKTLSGVRYSSISQLNGVPHIILPLDVEDTVTCFCRLQYYLFYNNMCSYTFIQYDKFSFYTLKSPY